MDPLVSVVIPIYNVEQYLDKCVESVVGQTYKNLEIILVDDGSPDTCPQKCDEWAAKDSRISVIHKKNGGLGFARNSGIDRASGEYITFVDSDDYLTVDAIETMLSRIEKEQSDLVVGQFVKVYPDGSQTPSSYPWMHDCVISKDEAMHMIGSLKKPLPCSAWAKLYRRTIFKDIRYPSLKSAEDTYTFPHVIGHCSTVSVTSTVVYHYVQRETSIIHNKTRVRQIDSLMAILHVARFLLERHYVEEAKVYYRSAIYRSVEMKGDQEAKKLIRDAFNAEERKLLGKRDVQMLLSMFSYRFPSVYQKLKKK
ncbi:MAG: glycosyltransferase family 2 protein [Clostridia bacterium]|nr:glycosyltransferase family 2 protein [Clostridia bacterium]